MLGKKDNNESTNVKIKSIIGPDAVFEGTLHAKETTRVDGLIKGDVKIDEVLILGVTGKVVGNVTAATIMVGGQVEGDLHAKEKIIISATGKVNGNLHTKKLIIDENAVFHGQCFMNEEAPAQGQQVMTQAAAPQMPAAQAAVSQTTAPTRTA